MNQSERRQILIRSLLKERTEYRKIEIPHNGNEQKKLLRSLMNIRMAAPVSGEFQRIVEDKGWDAAHNRYEDFIRRHKNLHIVFLELGVGMNTPIIIKYPFWRMTAENSKAVYVCINYGEALCPQEIEKQSICLDADIGKVILVVLAKSGQGIQE